MGFRTNVAESKADLIEWEFFAGGFLFYFYAILRVLDLIILWWSFEEYFILNSWPFLHLTLGIPVITFGTVSPNFMNTTFLFHQII